MKALLKLLPITTILGWFLPKTLAAYTAWQANKTPETTLALGENAANEILTLVDPALEATVEQYETLSAPLITSVFTAIEDPSKETVELAITEAVTLGATLLKSKADPAKIQAALAGLFDVINEETA